MICCRELAEKASSNFRLEAADTMDGARVMSSGSDGSGGERMDWIRSGEVMVAAWVCERPGKAGYK